MIDFQGTLNDYSEIIDQWLYRELCLANSSTVFSLDVDSRSLFMTHISRYETRCLGR